MTGTTVRKSPASSCLPSNDVTSFHGELAQLGERLVCNQEVTGSSPVFSTSLRSARAADFVARRELRLGWPALGVGSEFWRGHATSSRRHRHQVIGDILANREVSPRERSGA